MIIQELEKYIQRQFEELRMLMAELTDRVTLSQMDLMNVLRDSNCHLYVIVDSYNTGDTHEERIVGCATLCVFHSPTGTKASVEDVVVAADFRGQHLGRKLMEHVVEQARRLAPIELHLTSNPRRIAANRLYQSLGFLRKETNCYRMVL